MSVKMTSWVWDNGPSKPAEKLLLLALADHADDEGYCYPSLKRLAEMIQTSERYVRKIRDSLIEQNYIRLVKKGGFERSNKYQIVCETGTIVHSDGTIVPQEGGIYSSTKVNDSSTTVNNRSPGVNNRSPEPSLTINNQNKTPLGSPVAATPKTRTRTRKDDFYDKLVECFGQPSTSSERKVIGKAAAELNDVPGAEPEDVIERYKEAKSRWNGLSFTPFALLKHWTSLAEKQTSKSLDGNEQTGKDYFAFDAKDNDSLLENLGADLYE